MWRKIHVLAIIATVIAAAAAIAETNGKRPMLVTMHKHFNKDHLEKSIKSLNMQRRRRLGKQSKQNHANEYEDSEAEDVEYIQVLNEFSHVNTTTVHIELDEGTIKIVSNVEGVVSVEDDGPTWIDASQSTIFPRGSAWGLDRIDQAVGLDNKYDYEDKYLGEDIDMWIIDSGVFAGHEEFGDRVEKGRDFLTVPGVFDANYDCNGHGTHVASIAAGKSYGIAKAAKIVPVKAVGCDGRGTISALINGLQYAKDLSKQRKRKGVVNISLSAGYTLALNNAVKDAVNSGLVVVVAAGNQETDACNYSPSSETFAITVGGSSSDDSKLDISNFGDCVDIYAPGDNILAASRLASNEYTFKRGTSMASPAVAGIAAITWSKYPTMSQFQLISKVKANGVPPNNVVDKDCEGLMNPNLVAQIDGASGETPMSGKNRFVAKGESLQGDFTQWFLMPSTSTCVRFTARRTRGTSQPSNVLIAFGSQNNREGISAFELAPEICRNPNYAYYVLRVGADQINTVRKGQFSIGSTEPLLDLLSNTPTKMYARIIRSGAVAVVEVGTGSVLGENIIVSARDTSASRTAAMRYVAFSSVFNSDITYEDIEACDSASPPTPAPVSTPEPTTKRPTVGVTTPTPSVNSVPPPITDETFADYFLSSRSSARGMFSKFWKLFKDDYGDFCFQFDVKGRASALIALTADNVPIHYSNAELPFVIHLQRPKRAFNTNMKSFGGEVSSAKFPNIISNTTNVRIRILQVGGDLQILRRNAGGENEVVLEYSSEEISGLGLRYFSLTGLRKFDVEYDNISDC